MFLTDSYAGCTLRAFYKILALFYEHIIVPLGYSCSMMFFGDLNKKKFWLVPITFKLNEFKINRNVKK